MEVDGADRPGELAGGRDGKLSGRGVTQLAQAMERAGCSIGSNETVPISGTIGLRHGPLL